MNSMKKMNYVGMGIVIIFFLVFFVLSTFFLDKRKIGTQKIEEATNTLKQDDLDYHLEKDIINDLYNNVRIMYDVVNNKFRVSQEDTIVIGDAIYKKIINFDEVMDPLFTKNGIYNYINNLNNYFAYTENGYYLIGNLVSYQTYYFRGSNTNIYVLNANSEEINAIIYEKWISNNTNTLALIRAKKENNQWLVDNITILSSDQG